MQWLRLGGFVETPPDGSSGCTVLTAVPPGWAPPAEDGSTPAATAGAAPSPSGSGEAEVVTDAVAKKTKATTATMVSWLRARRGRQQMEMYQRQRLLRDWLQPLGDGAVEVLLPKLRQLGVQTPADTQLLDHEDVREMLELVPKVRGCRPGVPGGALWMLDCMRGTACVRVPVSRLGQLPRLLELVPGYSVSQLQRGPRAASSGGQCHAVRSLSVVR